MSIGAHIFLMPVTQRCWLIADVNFNVFCWKILLAGIFLIFSWFKHSVLELFSPCNRARFCARSEKKAQGNNLFNISYRVPSPPFYFHVRGHAQRWSGSHRLLHRDRRHGGAYQAWEDPRYLWPRHADALAEELHGPDGGPVHLHSRCAAGGRDLREHRGPRPEPVLLHPEADAGWTGRECHRHGAGVQGEDYPQCPWRL